jgi:hypothetical protein
MLYGATLVAATALVGCGGGTESVTSAADPADPPTGAMAGGTTATSAARLAAVTANSTPI